MRCFQSLYPVNCIIVVIIYWVDSMIVSLFIPALEIFVSWWIFLLHLDLRLALSCRVIQNAASRGSVVGCQRGELWTLHYNAVTRG